MAWCPWSTRRIYYYSNVYSWIREFKDIQCIDDNWSTFHIRIIIRSHVPSRQYWCLDEWWFNAKGSHRSNKFIINIFNFQFFISIVFPFQVLSASALLVIAFPNHLPTGGYPKTKALGLSTIVLISISLIAGCLSTLIPTRYWLFFYL